jgi:hypothetical protein
MSEEPFDPEITELERVLRTLAPTGGAASRDQILFRAGQLAARRRSLRMGALGLTLGAAIALGSSWTLKWIRAAPPEVAANGPAEQQALPQASQSGLSAADWAARWQDRVRYLRLEEDLSSRGLDALPRPPEPQGDPRLSLDQLLGAS